MQLKPILLILLVFCVAAAATAVGETIDLDKQLTLPVSGDLNSLEIDSGSGFLKIKGVKGLNQIEVNAKIVAKGMYEDELKEFTADKVKLSLRKRGNKAILVSKINSRIFSSIFKSRNVRIDLTVKVPLEMTLDIDDGSGLVNISDINGNIRLDDGSGSIKMEDVGGNVKIDDGSGSITLENIGGNLDIEDSSGSIQINEVGGDVSLDDGSGSMTVYKVKGSVIVDDGSGSIVIDGVKKDVDIRRAGSGGVSIQNVTGNIKR